MEKAKASPNLYLWVASYDQAAWPTVSGSATLAPNKGTALHAMRENKMAFIPCK